MGEQPWLRPGTPWAENAWEIIWGAILVQNTNWRNVEPALRISKPRQTARLRPLNYAKLNPLADVSHQAQWVL